MPASNLLALIDDIASTLDDVAAMTKIAAKKTSGVLGDDLALNAQQVTGVQADRELPIVWAVAKGSTLNKAILVPSALLLSTFLPWSITPLLVFGGLFLCFEGFEKVFEKISSKLAKGKTDKIGKSKSEDSSSTPKTAEQVEKLKVKGAVKTDFILSAEIIVITLGTVAKQSLMEQTLVLLGISVLMTVGVYGLVACIVKFDDLGLWLRTSYGQNSIVGSIGHGILIGTPYLMKGLGIVGTLAMFLVGGGILTHAWPSLHQLSQSLPLVVDLVAGLVGGGLVFVLIVAITKLRKKP